MKRVTQVPQAGRSFGCPREWRRRESNPRKVPFDVPYWGSQAVSESDGIETLEPKSVRKKLKQPSFAAGVHRDEVYAGAELLGLELDEHIANVVAAMRPIAAELGLRTSEAA